MCYNTNIMEDRDIWYSAGIVDGEGYIGIMKLKTYGPHNTYPYKYTPAVKIASVTESLINFLISNFGGYKSHRIHKNNQKDSWMWSITNWSRVEEFLNIIGTYLRMKDKQARVVLDFISLRRNRRLNKKRDLYRYTEEELQQMEDFYLKIRKLNFRGKSPATTE